MLRSHTAMKPDANPLVAPINKAGTGATVVPLSSRIITTMTGVTNAATVTANTPPKSMPNGPPIIPKTPPAHPMLQIIGRT